MKEDNRSAHRNTHRLIVKNDDIHSFAEVIMALQSVCGYGQYQAEQLAYIVHHTGEAEVKIDTDIEMIQSMYELLKSEWGLITEIR